MGDQPGHPFRGNQYVDHARNVAAAVASVVSPELLSPQWRKLVKPGDHPTTGHCYIAAEATWHLTGRDLKPRVANLGKGETHWWLETEKGEKVDPTAAQFDPKDLQAAYAKGKGCGFLTKEPSKRAQVLMDRVKARGHGVTISRGDYKRG